MTEYTKTISDLQDRLQREKRVIVDFDETLCLVNSTHAYLDSAHPSFLALLITKTIDLVFLHLIRDERLTAIYRDWLRVVAITVLLPWTYPLWRFHVAPRNAHSWMNTDLVRLLEQESATLVGVISCGFSPIIAPLLRHGGIQAPLVAGSFTDGWRIRANGKIRAWQQKLSHIDHTQTIFVTDSIDDADMLRACNHGTLIEWKHPPIQIFQHTYVPFLYTEKVKRAGCRYLDRGVLRQDIFAVLLSFTFIPQFSFSLLFAVVLFQLSFWLTYEFGYFDNDQRAAFEKKGTLAPGYALHRQRMRVAPAAPFILAFMLTGAALLAAAPDIAPMGTERSGGASSFLPEVAQITGLWLLFLGASHVVFRLYNRTREKARILLYPVLQLTRLVGMALFLALTPVGVAIIGGFVIGRTIPYIVYRATGVRWGECNRLLVFLAFATIIFLMMLSRTLSWRSPLFVAHLVLATGWLLLRSKGEIARLFTSPHH